MNATVITTPGARPRLRIQLNARQIFSRPDSSSVLVAPRPAPKTVDIKRRNATFSYRYCVTTWKHKGKQYSAYRMTNGRVTVKRSRFADLRSVADEWATAEENHETARLELSPADQASLLRARELLAPIGVSLEVAAGIYTECVQLLKGRASPVEAIRDYLLRHPAGVSPKSIPETVSEFKSRPGKRGRGKKWQKNLWRMLDRFAGKFTGQFSHLTACSIDDWLDSLKNKQGGPADLETRQNYRTTVSSLIEFAKSRGYAPKDFNVMADVSNPEPPNKPVNIYTPDELVLLLNKAESHRRYKRRETRPYEKLVPFIVITAFAGVRHGEMSEDKVRLLDWADFDWETKQIFLDGAAAKGTRRKDGDDRVIDMPENLVEWLTPYVRKSGRICPIRNTGEAICNLRRLAGIKGNRRNALRKSFITYQLALGKGIVAVADQAGNSESMIKRRYKAKSHTRQRHIAERWFSIKPSRAEVLPLWQMAGKLHQTG